MQGESGEAHAQKGRREQGTGKWKSENGKWPPPATTPLLQRHQNKALANWEVRNLLKRKEGQKGLGIAE